MFETPRVTTKITMLRYILKNIVDKLSTEKWTRRQRRPKNSKGIQRKPIGNLNRAITKKESIFIVKKKLPSETKYLGTDCFTGEFPQTFQEK